MGFCRCILYNPKIIHFNCIFQGFKNSIKTQLFSIKCIFRLVCFSGAFFAKTPLFSGFFGLFYSILICIFYFKGYTTYGYCASQKLYFYGYKLHAVCSLNGVIKNFDISPASVHDIHYLKDIGEQMRNCTLIGDRGYLSAKVQIDLFNYANIKLDTPMRSNQKDYIPQFSLYKKKRKRIETFFSQLCDQFMIKRNYAKTFEGFKTRIISKITAATVIQYINKFIFQRKLNHLKISII
uniref:IS982 family transposase n=1 Tax=Riemerella anatipestifer TaxID=34085 RepID=UPI002889654B|nr:IS982 family transposase [Riemerella anatipestifer]